MNNEKSYIKHLFAFFKKETVFCVSLLLAILSFLPVDASFACLEGIDWHVLALLFCLMSVVAGLQKLLVFRRCGNLLISRLHHTRGLFLILIYLCYFSSIILTNDVALITFVPFAILLLPMVEQEKQLIPLIVLQTIAANLGSMLTPLGNPQNLYLYSISDMTLTEFLLHMLPLWCVSLILVTIPVFFFPNVEIRTLTNSELPNRNVKKEFCFTLLFLLCILCVMDLIPYYILFVIILLSLLILDRSLLADIDYFLLMTFICFFLFIYNIKQLPVVTEFLANIIEGNEFLVGTLASQLISNVPAALLLSGFTEEYKMLLLGVNVGGLGTLIASLASLISFKLYAATKNSKSGTYFVIFTIWNVLFLIILVPITILFYAR